MDYKIPGHEKAKVVLFRRKHWIAFWPGIVIVGFGFLVPLILLYLARAIVTLPSVSNFVVLMISIYYLVLSSYSLGEWQRFYYDAVVCTEEELLEVIQEGIVNRRIIEIPLVDIENITATMNNFLESVFIYGTLTIEVGGQNVQTIIIKAVPNPVSAADKILQAHNRAVEIDERGEKIEALKRDLRSDKYVTEFSTKESSHPSYIRRDKK